MTTNVFPHPMTHSANISESRKTFTKKRDAELEEQESNEAWVYEE